ncbi:cytochrome P450 [Halotia wernerae UHCC 0503]|nr:cytochrome P450 [Halotia wernerae UHCC 0503]
MEIVKFKRSISLAEFANTFLPFGIILIAALLAAEFSPNLNLHRAIYAFWASTLLLIPAIYLYISLGKLAKSNNYWLLLWTFSFVAYLVHLFYEVFVISGNVKETFVAGGTAIATVKLILGFWWGLDIALAWFGDSSAKWIQIERIGINIYVGLSFLIVNLIFQEGLARTLGVILAIAIVVALLVRSQDPLNNQNIEDLPPGSFGLPLIGETIALAWDNHKFYRDRLQKYGSVFKTHLFGKPVIAFIGPEAFTFFLDQKYFTREKANPQPIQELLDWESLPLLDGEQHRDRKNLILQAFTPQAFDKYIPLIEEVATYYLKQWEQLGSFAWIPEYRKLSASLTNALFTGGVPGPTSEAVGEIIETFVKGFTSVPINLRWNGYGKALQSRDKLLALIDKAIAHHRHQPQQDMLGILLQTRREDGSSLTDEQLRREVLHLFFAAYGGIYISLTFLSMTLAQHPEMMMRAREEVNAHVPDGSLNMERLQDLVYLKKIAYEIRRFYPINAATFFAQAKQECEFQNYRIPKGWGAVGGIHTTMHLPQVFPQPEQFKPCRFAPEQFAALPENSYVPHGGGAPDSHRCPGEDLITVLIKVIAVHLLRKYNWELPPQNLELNCNLFPIPQDGLKVNFGLNKELLERKAVS